MAVRSVPTGLAISARDPQVLDALLRAAEGDPKVEAHLRAAHAERGAALDLSERGDIAGAKRHVEAATGAVDEVVALWHVQDRKEFHGAVVEVAAVLREDMAVTKFQLGEPFEEVVELLEFALGLHEKLHPGGDGVARCLSTLADVHEQVGDKETARRYFQRALELRHSPGD